ncbi:MAG TPA: DUF2997 domain-containing protein [Anaeromyxobacteraceae bacterium]
MAEKLEIEVVIGADGTVRLETRGLKGPECLAETTGLEKALGRVVRRERTSEYYQRVATGKAAARRK